MFPFVDKAVMVECKLVAPDGYTLPTISLDFIREALAARLTKDRVPPELNFKTRDQWHWCWLDDDGPITAGEYLLFGFRRWVKRPPGSLVKEMITERCEAWRKSNDVTGKRIPKDVKANIKDEVEDEVLRDTPPSLSDEAVLLGADWTVYTFTQSNAIHTAIVDRLVEALMALLERSGAAHEGRGISLTKTYPRAGGIREYIQRQRAREQLPGAVVDEYLAWLAGLAAEEAWHRMTPKGAKPEHVRVTLGDKLTLATGETQKETIRYSGEDLVRTAIVETLVNDENARVREINLALEDGANIYDVVVRATGMLGLVTIRAAIDYGKDWNVAAMDRAGHFRGAERLCMLLWELFNLTRLQSLMKSLPQQGLWSCKPKDVAIDHEAPPKDKTPLEREAERNATA